MYIYIGVSVCVCVCVCVRTYKMEHMGNINNKTTNVYISDKCFI